MQEEEVIKKAVSDIIRAIGENPSREGLRDTPQRVAEMYSELFHGIDKGMLDGFQPVANVGRIKFIENDGHIQRLQGFGIG